MPALISWRPSHPTARPTGRRSPPRPRPPASASPPTTAGPNIYSRILVERIEPHLGIGRPSILCDYPASEAALARRKPGDPRLAERFELYACGVELANAFGELTDPAEQRARFEADMDEKQRLYGERYPIDEDFLAALVAMPETSGIALGFDRLVIRRWRPGQTASRT